MQINNFLKNDRNKELLLIISVIIIAFAVRLPFLLSDIGFNNDAGIYSDNIEKAFFSGSYDVQPPGYVSYIYLGRVINKLTDNSVAAQHIINMLLVFFISIIFFKLLKLLNYGNFETFVFSIIFSFNNILMLGSITGGNRLFLTLTSIVLIYYSCSIIFENKKSGILWFALFFAFFIGFRQDLSINFIPLYIYLIYKIRDFKLSFYSILIFTLICLTWFVPLLIEYGGLLSYFYVIKNQKAVYDTSLIFSFGKINSVVNMTRVFIYLLNAFLFTFIFYIVNRIKKGYKISKELFIILVFSLVPAFIFQLLVHNGNFVHLAAFMTPFFILLISNFKINSKSKIIFSVLIIFLLLFQFFGIKMFRGESVIKKTANVLWLQYSYDGAKSGETNRLSDIKK